MDLSALESFTTVQLIYLIAAMGLYLPLSMKQLDIGAAGYFALGAYGSAVLTRDYDVPFPLALLAAAVVGAAGALIVDSLATRVRLTGFAYAIFSLSFAEALRIVLNNVDSLGGSGGFVGIPSATTLPVVALLAGGVLIGLWGLDHTRLGQLRTAIADDEFVVPVFGVPLVATKLTVFGLGGALCGLAGALYAHYVLFIRPDDFDFSLLISLQLPIVFGGLDRFYGAAIGSLALGTLPEFVRGLAQYRLIFIAAATLVVLTLRPSGLITHGTIAALKQALHRVAARPSAAAKPPQHPARTGEQS